jgi:pimeloyl-ACP methyl ester carboxylesterase
MLTMVEWCRTRSSIAAVSTPDMRGLGGSSRPPLGYDKRTVAHDIYQLVRQLGFEKIFLVGHVHWGGPVAYAYACAYPEVALGVTSESL